jgi:type I restriction enzyme S subunit
MRAIVDVQDGNHGELYPRRTDFGNRGVPFISAENVDDEVHIDRAPILREEVANHLRVGFAQPGDVILTHNATVGRVAIVPPDAPRLVLSTSTTYYRTDSRALLAEYLALFMKSRFFQDQLHAVMEQTTRNQVPVTKQVELRVAVPPMKVQREVVNRVGRLLGNLGHAEGRIRRAASHLERSAEALLVSAFA